MQRNAGGRQFKTAGRAERVPRRQQNAAGGIDGVLLPLVGDDARFGDTFRSLDVRLSRSFKIGGRRALEAMVECFNVFNMTNVLGSLEHELLGLRQRARPGQRGPESTPATCARRASARP